jgi:hypothetical protein
MVLKFRAGRTALAFEAWCEMTGETTIEVDLNGATVEEVRRPAIVFRTLQK